MTPSACQPIEPGAILCYRRQTSRCSTSSTARASSTRSRAPQQVRSACRPSRRQPQTRRWEAAEPPGTPPPPEPTAFLPRPTRFPPDSTPREPRTGPRLEFTPHLTVAPHPAQPLARRFEPKRALPLPACASVHAPRDRLERPRTAASRRERPPGSRRALSPEAPPHTPSRPPLSRPSSRDSNRAPPSPREPEPLHTRLKPASIDSEPALASARRPRCPLAALPPDGPLTAPVCPSPASPRAANRTAPCLGLREPALRGSRLERASNDLEQPLPTARRPPCRLPAGPPDAPPTPPHGTLRHRHNRRRRRRLRHLRHHRRHRRHHHHRRRRRHHRRRSHRRCRRRASAFWRPCVCVLRRDPRAILCKISCVCVCNVAECRIDTWRSVFS